MIREGETEKARKSKDETATITLMTGQMRNTER